MRVGIIGGGISGLSSAYELSKKGHDVTIFERAKVAGGLGTYIPIAGNHIERFYHHFFASDKLIINLSQELKLGRKLKFYNSKTGIFIENKIYPFSSMGDIL